VSALDDRRMAARKAYLHKSSGDPTNPSNVADGVDSAVGAATRVQITPEVMDAYYNATGTPIERLRAAFAAAGFEVIA
jgi:hypothetical protein